MANRFEKAMIAKHGQTWNNESCWKWRRCWRAENEIFKIDRATVICYDNLRRLKNESISHVIMKASADYRNGYEVRHYGTGEYQLYYKSNYNELPF
jgi:hypothetical protein